MKTKQIFRLIALFISASVVISCSKDSDNGDGDGDGTTALTSLTVTSDVSAITLGNNEAFTFTVTGNDNVDYTSTSTIFVDDVAISGSSYTPTTDGALSVRAERSNLTSSAISLTVNAEQVNTFAYTQKVLVEDYTGTWCGFCPRLAYNLEQAEMQDDRVIGVGLHDDDDMLFPGVTTLESEYNVSGFPSGRINRNINWNESIAQVMNYVGENADLGLAINSSLNASTINLTVKVGHNVNLSGTKLVVYLNEDGLVYPQANYMNNDPNSPWYQAGNPIADFVHDNTARIAFTNVLGDAIPDAQGVGEYTRDFTLTVPASVQDTNNLEIVAFVLGSDGRAINAQHANLGEDKAYD